MPDYVLHGQYYDLGLDKIRNGAGWGVSCIETHEGFNGHVVIPAQIEYEGNSCNVVKICADAFKGKSDLVEISIPQGVTSVGERAFCGCGNLIRVTGFAGVTKIGDRAFEGTGLKATPWDGDDDALTSLGKFVFHNCAGMTKACVPGRVRKVGDGDFDGCGNLAFRDCDNLQGIDIRNRRTTIGAGAFEGCASMAEVRNSEWVTDIGFRALGGCRKLNRIEPENLRFVGDEAFAGCENPGNPELYPYTITEGFSDGTWENKKIFRHVDEFMEVRGEPDSRYLSYDYVHEAFVDAHVGNLELNPEGYDRLALDLYMFLASWGDAEGERVHAVQGL